MKPNEPLPVIRRRVRTEFTLSDKLLTEPTTEEEERLSKLELETEIQRKIVDASFKLLNELNHKKSVRKQRKANYETALQKLSILEKKLAQAKKELLEEHQMKYQSKKRLIEQHLPPAQVSVNGHHNGYHAIQSFRPSNILSGSLSSNMPLSSLVSQGPVKKDHLISKAGRKRHDAIHRREASYHSFPAQANSVPSSPLVAKKEYRVTPLSPPEVDQAMETERFLPHPDPPAVKAPPVTAPIPSTSSVPLKTPITPTSILKKGNRNRQSDRVKKGVTIGEDVIDLGPPSLTRSNSAENVRRKSYVSAVNSPPTAPSFRDNHYYNDHSLGHKHLPKNPPPPVPQTTVVNMMAKRPLPPTPTSFVADTVSLTEALQLENQSYLSTNTIPRNQISHSRERSEDDNRSHNETHVRNGSQVDISSKAVRSSVVRTPARITISTTSSADAGVVFTTLPDASASHPQSSLPTPVPSPPPSRKPSVSNRHRVYSGPASSDVDVESVIDSYLCPSPTPSSASTMALKQSLGNKDHYQETFHGSHQELMDSIVMGPPTGLPPRKPKSNLSGRQKPPPLTLDHHLHQQPVKHSSRSVTPCESIPETPGVDQDVFDSELIPPQSPFISLPRPCVETPRPDPIPISPQINVTEGVVDVVSVGTYTPYWEETKPFEMSDFLKYSAKHRKRSETASTSSAAPVEALPESKVDASAAKTLSPTASVLDSSFMVSGVSNEFHDEVFDWYDENVKKGTVV